MNLEQEYESKNQLVAQQKPICFAAPNAEWQPLAGSDRSELAESFFLSILTQTDQISLGPLQARQAHKYRLATPVLCVVCMVRTKFGLGFITRHPRPSACQS